LKKNSHCSYCGQLYDDPSSYPLTCKKCGQITFLNPTPVAVVLLPVDAGLLAIRRSIEPHKGSLALPGGYINLGETWQQAAVREVLEESGIQLDPSELTPFDVQSAPDDTLLVYTLALARKSSQLPRFRSNPETSEWVVIDHPGALAFPLHLLAAQKFFKKAANENYQH
jgi:ADP-ribose pyrophosphatase YjhB (NUDIX family)